MPSSTNGTATKARRSLRAVFVLPFMALFISGCLLAYFGEWLAKRACLLWEFFDREEA